MCHSKQLAELAMLLVFPFLLLCYGVGNIHCSTIHENREDLRSLQDFKQGITEDPNGALSNWNTSTHFCRWNGVNCSSTPPFRVTKLNLIGQSLGGQLSPSLRNLTFLQELYLANNSFVGTIPPLSNLQHLEILYLQNNHLHGVIPDALTNCSNLINLVLSGNQLTGVIPPSIGFLSKLIGFGLERNNLEGVIPATLGNITTLRIILFGENQLVGTIPDKFWQMPSLQYLYLGANNLSGRIPQIPSNTSSFEELSLAGNMLGGTLPSNMGDAFPNLKKLYLGNNGFTGPIPASLGNASSLFDIDLPKNNFTSQIPSTFGNLLGLVSLNLGGNMLEARDSGGWEFFHALRNCSILDSLTLSNNQLQGSIPNSIADLPTSLTWLQMGGNQLSGIVPTSIGKLDGLTKLSLDINNLTGTIEEWLGKLTNLYDLEIQSNNFIGTIPPSISSLKQLTKFSLAQNRFAGSLPPSLGNLVHLSTLNFSYNSFQGSIPAEFGNFRQLISLDLSSNKLSGEIPITFSNLKTLTMLNLSHNNLSGLLPTSLNDIKSLTRLDLSYNNFQGAIPTDGVFENPTVVSLDGNPGLCGGAMELHRPSCRVVSKRVPLINYLIKILIPIFGFMSLVLGVYFLFVEKKRKREYTLEHSLGEHFQNVTYKDLALATRDFSESNLIGKGSYGSVHRGKLKESKMEVAVKVFNLEMPGAERSFMAECEALRSIQHRNLLPIITACSTVDTAGNVFKALLYELMPNGNLDTWLHHKGDEEAPRRLGLTQRIRIAVNLADALDYLHHDCGRPTVHRDLKPSNILLDDDMNALLGDFGIGRFYVDPQSTWAGSSSSIGVKGTIGYIPPEYGGGGHASTSGDVYSFGILLLEILTSKRPTDPMFVDGLDIISFVKNSFPDQIFQVIDAHLVEECKNLNRHKNVPETEINQCLVDLMQVALSCTRSLPSVPYLDTKQN